MNNTSSSPAALQAEYVGKQLEDVSLPAAVLDRAIVKRNCGQMLKACDALGVMFRPHVKTHKVNGIFSCFAWLTGQPRYYLHILPQELTLKMLSSYKARGNFTFY